jgi:hypothetical protein
MDTMTVTTRPEWLKTGAIVRVQFWCGTITDWAITDAGRLFVWVYGPKNAACGQRHECLEFDAEKIAPATDEEIMKDIRHYSAQVDKLTLAYAAVCEDLKSTVSEWSIKE